MTDRHPQGQWPLEIPAHERANVYLDMSGSRCGKRSCRCARGERHPSVRLRFWAWDQIERRWKPRCKFVRKADVEFVREMLEQERQREQARRLAEQMVAVLLCSRGPRGRFATGWSSPFGRRRSRRIRAGVQATTAP